MSGDMLLLVAHIQAAVAFVMGGIAFVLTWSVMRTWSRWRECSPAFRLSLLIAGIYAVGALTNLVTAAVRIARANGHDLLFVSDFYRLLSSPVMLVITLLVAREFWGWRGLAMATAASALLFAFPGAGDWLVHQLAELLMAAHEQP